MSDELRGRPGHGLAVAPGLGGQEDSIRYLVEETNSTELKRGDRVLVGPGQLVPANGEIAEGAALIDEAVVTGESTPVLREAGGRYAQVMAGVRIVSGTLLICVSARVR